MNLFDRATTRDLAIAGGIAATGALLMGLVMASLSAPPEQKARLAALDQELAQVTSLSRISREGPTLPPGAICTKAPAEEAQVLANAIKDDAGQFKLTVTGLEVAPAAGTDGRLAAVRIRYEASGPYEAALGLLDLMSKRSPQIYADSVDLTSKGSSVTLAFSGRAFCSV